MDKILYFVVLFLIPFVASQSGDFNITIECVRNCKEYNIDPTQEVVLVAKCNNNCDGVDFTPFMGSQMRGSHKIRNDIDTSPNKDNKTIYTIKPNVLTGDWYRVYITGEKLGGESRKGSINLKIKEQVTQPVEDPLLDSGPLDYDDEYFHKEAQKLTPAEIVKIVTAGEKELKKSDGKDSATYANTQKKLLIYLENLPTNTQAAVDEKFTLMMKIAFRRKDKVTPFIANHVIKLEKQISASTYALLKKNKRPEEKSKEIKKFSEEILNGMSNAAGDKSSRTLTEHQTEEPPTEMIGSVIDSKLPAEKYPAYNDFDVNYQAKKKSGEKIMTNMLDVIRILGNANAMTMGPKITKSEIVTTDYCLLNIVDQNRNSIKQNYSICESGLYLSSWLIAELRSELRITAVLFSVIKKDIFWWTNDNSDSKFVFIEVSEKKTNKLLQKLIKPIGFSAPATYSYTEKKNGVFRMPVNKSYEELRDKDLTVHQLSIEYHLQALLIQFTDMQEDDEFKVVIMVNRRPSMKDFSNNYVKVSQKMTDDKKTVLHKVSASAGSFCYVALLPANKKKTEYTYKIKFSQISCELWDEGLKQWNSYECTVDAQTNKDRIFCNCNHLSLYCLRSRNVKSKIIEDLEIEVGILQEYNYVVLITTSVVLFLYLAGVVFVLYKNRRRLKRKKLLFLLDNKLSDKHEYYIVVYTGTKKYSQTTSNIGIKIYGTHGESPPHLLRGHYEPVLQNASEDWFYLLTEKNLGEITKIDLWSDYYGCRTNWYCEKVEVYDVENNQKWFFQVYDWISVFNERTVHTIEAKQIQAPVLRTRWDYAKHGLKNHLWIKSFQKLNFPTFTYIERVTVMLSIIICNMNMCLCMLEIPTLDFVSLELGFGHFIFGFGQFGIALASSAISFLIHRVLIYFFSNSRNFNFHKIRTNVIIRYPAIVRLISWISLMMILITNLSSLIVFGVWISHYSSCIWVATTLVAIALCIIIFETVYVMAWSTIKKKFLRLKLSLDISEIEAVKETLFKKYGNNGVRDFFRMYYRPISDAEKKIKFELQSYRIEARNIIADIIMFSVYVIILFGVVLLNQDSRSHFSANNIKQILIENSFCNCSTSLNSIRSKESFFEYLEDVILPSVHTTHWYRDYYSNEAGLLKDFNTKMLGIPILRQIRIKNNTCYITQSMKKYVSTCNKDYQMSLQESKNFAPKWKYKDENDRSVTDHIDQIWMYQNWFKSQTASITGYIAHYPAGGYLVPLGRTLQNARRILNYIKSTNWIDELTRVIFLEASFYNVNENLFNILTIIIEKSASGKFVPSYSLRTSRYLFVNNEIRIAITIAFIMFIVMMLVFTWKQFTKIQEFGWSKLSMFFKDAWNIVDILIIILGFGFILIHFFRTWTVQNLMEDLEKSAHNEYVSFNSALYWDEGVTISGTVLIVISTVRLAKLLRFLRSFKICELTLYLSAKYLIVMGIVNTILILAYGTVGYVLFGAYSYDFHSVTESFLSILLLAFGYHSQFDYDLFMYKCGFIGFAYYIGFMVLVMILLNIFITVIMVSYGAAIHYVETNEEGKLVSYNVYNFLVEEYRLFRSKSKGRVDKIRLRGGESKTINEMMLPSAAEISVGKQTLNIARKRVTVDSKRISEMFDKVDSFLDHITNPNEKNDPAVVLSRYLTDTDLNIEPAKETQAPITDKRVYYVVPKNEGEVYCAKNRQNDMKLIVNYLLSKSHKNKNQTEEQKKTKLTKDKTADSHEELISSMNTTVLEMINSITRKQHKEFATKSTNVTFDDLGYELVPDDENE